MRWKFFDPLGGGRAGIGHAVYAPRGVGADLPWLQDVVRTKRLMKEVRLGVKDVDFVRAVVLKRKYPIAGNEWGGNTPSPQAVIRRNRAVACSARWTRVDPPQSVDNSACVLNCFYPQTTLPTRPQATLTP